jgi:hypothetical protein
MITRAKRLTISTRQVNGKDRTTITSAVQCPVRTVFDALNTAGPSYADQLGDDKIGRARTIDVYVSGLS